MKPAVAKKTTLDRYLRDRYLRRALIVNDGSFAFVWERPVTTGLLAVSAICLLAPAIARAARR